MNNKINKIDIEGNIIELLQTNHQNYSSCSSTYNEWNGSYRILSSTKTVTQETVNKMLKNGFFGFGQIVHALLLDEPDEIVINYYGLCDSGG